MSESKFSKWPAEQAIFPVSDVLLRVVEGQHPYFVSNEVDISANWNAEFAANPALFNGQMMLARSLEIRDGFISGDMHTVSYATFLLWRKTRQADTAIHIFGLPIVMSADGAMIVVRMGTHTANPGRVYCAAGSLDPDDIRDGICDIDGNMAREVMEETGLDLRDAQRSDGYHALYERGIVTVFRLYRFAETAEELVDRIERHIAVDPHGELDAVYAVRTPDPSCHPYPSFMPPILDWVFSERA
jgi:8-oxo-dGTP pyrophosphatase MutT (NUDIX family)